MPLCLMSKGLFLKARTALRGAGFNPGSRAKQEEVLQKLSTHAFSLHEF